MARGRPRKPDHLRPVKFTVRIVPAAYDVADKAATLEGISLNALVQRTLERIFTHPTIRERTELCYGALQAIPSTLTGLMGGSSTHGRYGSSAAPTTGSSPETDVSQGRSLT